MRTFGYPKLLLQLEMEMADGKVERVCSDETWKLTTDGPIRANNEYDGEIYDARKEMAGWSRPGFARRGWQTSASCGGPGRSPFGAADCAHSRHGNSQAGCAFTKCGPAYYIFDMGQNMVGWCRLTVAGPRGTKVTLRHAERLRPNGMLYMDNLRSAEATDIYILKGSGTEVYEPRFTYHGFRYVEVKGFPGKPTLASLEGREVHDDVEQRFGIRHLESAAQPDLQSGAVGDQRQLPQHSHGLPAARRAPGLAGRPLRGKPGRNLYV